jgi:hypothetical protein
VLEEGAGGDAPLELPRAEEVVVLAVALTRPGPARGRRDRDLEEREAGKDALDQGALARARRSGDDDDARSRP